MTFDSEEQKTMVLELVRIAAKNVSLEAEKWQEAANLWAALEAGEVQGPVKAVQ